MQQYVQGFLLKQFNNLWITNQARLNIISNGQHRFTLRNSDDLYVPFCRLTSISRQPFFTIPKIWSELRQPELQIIREKIEFNFKLKEHFINKLSNEIICGRLLCPHCHL